MSCLAGEPHFNNSKPSGELHTCSKYSGFTEMISVAQWASQSTKTEEVVVERHARKVSRIEGGSDM